MHSEHRLELYQNKVAGKFKFLLAAGPVALVLAYFLYPLGDPWTELATIFIVFGVFAVPIGAAFTLVRMTLVLDKRLGTGTTGLMLFGWQFWGRTFRLDAVQHVTVKPVRDEKGRVMFHAAHIEGPERPVEIWSPESYEAARRQGERTAAFLGVPLHDSARALYSESGETLEVRQPDAFDLSIAEQARRRGEPLTFPVPPAGSRIRIIPHGNEYLLELPGLNQPGLTGAIAALWGAPPVLGGLTLGWIYWHMGGGRFALAGLVPLLLVLVLLTPICGYKIVWALNMSRFGERIIVGPDRLRHETRTRFRRRAEDVPAMFVEELGYTPVAVRAMAGNSTSIERDKIGHYPAIAARTDYVTLQAGVGLTQAEQVCLHDFVRYALTKETKGPA